MVDFTASTPAPTPESDTSNHAFMLRASVGVAKLIPFYSSLIRAGFPSPAENYIERVCDLNDLCIDNAEATYFVRVTGDSMSGDRIGPGDILIVDCSYPHTDNKICVVWLNGEHTVKRMHHAGGPGRSEVIVLMPSNPNYEPIYVQEGDDFRVFGVVTYVILKPR